MNSFYMNGYLWRVKFVRRDDWMLIDRTNKLRVATTSPTNYCVYLSEDLDGPFLVRVFTHELSHCALFSFGLLRDIHRMVEPQYWIEAEEWICNFMADYGLFIYSTMFEVLGDEALYTVPYWLEELIRLRKRG